LSQERPGSWYEPKTLCGAHKQAAMLPTGETLEAFFGRMGPGAWLPEGEPFSFVINPVIVANHRGWLYLKFGGYAVYEEVFPSSNFFEWATMHWAVDALYEARPVPNGPGIVAARKLAWGGWAYQRMVDGWLRQRNITFPRSVEEAYEIVRALPSPYSEDVQPKGDCDGAILTAYELLVARRFGHFGDAQ
jgi:hypothetical protein